jgi:hypothetical protein
MVDSLSDITCIEARTSSKGITLCRLIYYQFLTKINPDAVSMLGSQPSPMCSLPYLYIHTMQS